MRAGGSGFNGGNDQGPMPVITLPDGSQKSFDQPITVAELAASIGSGLAKAALAGKVNGRLVDTSSTIDHDAASASSPTRTPRASRSSATPPRTCSPMRFKSSSRAHR